VTAPLFYVDPLPAGDVIVIDGAEGHHAADVRRLRAGELVVIGDGHGSLADGVVTEAGRGVLRVEVTARRDEPPPALRLVVAQALAKGGRDEDAVEAMTEVGVDEVVGWQARRSIARWTDRTAQRWRATARTAAKQARRAWVPTIAGPVTTNELADTVRAAATAIVLHEGADAPLSAVLLPSDGDVLLIVGPEGGIDEDELRLFADAGAQACRLGPHVVRTSTAGVAAISVLSATSRWR